MTSPDIRAAIDDLMADYCHYLDDDRLEEWLDFFTEDCQYKILSRENEEGGLPLELLSCRNKNMLRDRILSLREANIYNIHFDKHLLGAVRILGEENGGYRVQANYSVYQSNQDGISELFSVGTYRDLIVFDGGTPLFREKVAVTDTFGIARLLSTPI
ncbi:MAG: anthranilate 1,2-dioxygenase [Rhodospirillaceae bacterium]|nr:anthranilate 1,2-dioxygenase [Rhodospirillaceae bacterium]